MFNDFRNNVAGGEIKGFPKAIRMVKMSWCEDLAYLAQLNVITCQSRPDRCHSTNRFEFPGQNRALFIYDSGKADYKDEYIIMEEIENWFSYRKFATAKTLVSFVDESPNKKVGQFTIVVNEKNSHVGCAAVRFSLEFYNHFIFTCNFARRNVVDQPVYISGPEAASGCRNRRAFDYPNLCSDNDIEKDNIDYYY